MTYQYLSKDEKVNILEGQLRNLEYSQFSLEVNKIAEQARIAPDAEKVSGLTAEIAEKQTQIDAIQAELTAVEAS